MGVLPSPFGLKGSGFESPAAHCATAGRLPVGHTTCGTEGHVLEKLIIQKTLRVPASTGAAGDGSAVARQLDAALLDAGFSASGALLSHVGALDGGPALDLAATVVAAVRELVGDHVRHNTYF